MRSRWLLFSLAAAMISVACLDRKTGGSDGATEMVDIGIAQSSDSSAADAPAAFDPDSGSVAQDVDVSRLSPLDSADVALGAGGAGGMDGHVDGSTGGGGASGAGANPAAGASENGGVVIVGGVASRGGGVSSGGVIATGGVVGSAGVAGSSATSGVVGVGGFTGTGGTTCHAKPRDCTSSLDLDCNGQADNQESPCTGCPLGSTGSCSTGFSGVCAAGTRTCQLAIDHQTLGWSTCSQNVPKRARDCTSSSDNDCNGEADSTETAYCQCSPIGSTRTCSTGLNGICGAGTQTCSATGDKTTSNWGSCVQNRVKGTESCANPGSDDDCDGMLDNIPVVACNVGIGLGACANGGYLGCNGTMQVCNTAVVGIGDSTTFHTHPAPNGSWDWDCDGAVTKQYPDTAPTPPDCSGGDINTCGTQPKNYYALNPFACGDMGDIGSQYCSWLSVASMCTNKSGQSTGYQQGCR